MTYATVLKANPYHDETGRFANKDKATFVSVGAAFEKTHARSRVEASKPKLKPTNELTAADLKSLGGSIKDKSGKEFTVVADRYGDNADKLRFTVYDTEKWNGKQGHNTAGEVVLRKNREEVMNVFVRDEFQRKGVASQLYKHIEGKLGYKLKANDALTDDGEAFWKSRASKFDSVLKSDGHN